VCERWHQRLRRQHDGVEHDHDVDLYDHQLVHDVQHRQQRQFGQRKRVSDLHRFRRRHVVGERRRRLVRVGDYRRGRPETIRALIGQLAVNVPHLLLKLDLLILFGIASTPRNVWEATYLTDLVSLR
jgi:hypothetical protein